jgi:biotin operon repressor
MLNPLGYLCLIFTTNALKGRKTTTMKTSYEMMKDLENAIRADERAKLREQLRNAWNDHGKPLVESIPQTGMHGEPLAPVGPVPVAKPVPRIQRSHLRLVKELQRGFQAVPTLAGNLGVKKQTIYAMLHTLKKNGYQVEVKTVSGTAARYRRIYRLARSA